MRFSALVATISGFPQEKFTASEVKGQKGGMWVYTLFKYVMKCK